MPQVGDDVVARLAFELGDPREIELRRGRLEGGDLFGADRQSQEGFALGEQDPDPAPGREAVGAREDRRHFARRVALVERVLGLLGAEVSAGEVIPRG